METSEYVFINYRSESKIVNRFNRHFKNLIINHIAEPNNSVMIKSGCDGNVNELILITNNIPVNIIFRHMLRLSFQNKSPVEVFYDISFSDNFSHCLGTLYLLDCEKLRYLQSCKSELKKTRSTAISHNLFPESYGKLIINIFRFKYGFIISCLDRSNNIPICFSSWDLIKDPIHRFKSYLHQMTFPSYMIVENIFLEKLYLLLTNFSKKDVLFQKNLIDTVLRVNTFYLPMLKLRSYVSKRKPNEKEKDLINKILKHDGEIVPPNIKIPSEVIVHLPSKHSFYYTLENLSDGQSALLSIHLELEEISSDSINNLLKEILGSQKGSCKINKLEITVHGHEHLKEKNSVVERLELLKIDDKYLKTFERIVFVFYDNDLFDDFIHYPYILHNPKEVSAHFPKGTIKIIGNTEIVHVDSPLTSNKQLFSDISTYIYYHKCKFLKGDWHKNDNLFGISIIVHDGEKQTKYKRILVLKELYAATENLIRVIKQKLEENTNKEGFNHILFNIFYADDIHDDEIKKITQRLVQKFSESFIETNVISISFRCRIPIRLELMHYDFKEIILKFKNNTGYFFKALYGAADYSNELRRRKTLKQSNTWCYDIPDLLDYSAKKFCSSLKINFQETVETNFIELDVDPSSIKTDDLTGIVDCNHGRLEVALNEKGAPRSYGQNKSGIVIGIHTLELGLNLPVRRVLIIGDLTHSSKGSITSQECLRINLAIRYAYEHGLPIDWFTASFGVEIHDERGVENLDASATTCREIVQFSQDFGVPINIIVNDINIGAQSYWDALAAICQDTHSILIMTSKGTMSLTGHYALTSAFYKNLHSEDIPQYAKNLYPEGLQNLSGYQQIHGPNGEATKYAPNLLQACEMLAKHHYFTYSKHYTQMTSHRPMFVFDPIDRNILEYQHSDSSISINKELENIRKGFQAKRYAIIEALRDQGSLSPLYLWQDAKGWDFEVLKKGCMPQISSTIVCEIILGRRPVMLIFPPLGPLTPLDSEIISRAINKASGHLPVVILGNLTGFNSDPLSMQNRQLTQGASIVRAIVHYQGALVVTNLGYMIGGSYVVFSKQLNSCMKIIAIEGAKAQVVGGNIASKIVFHSRICQKAKEDPRFTKVNAELKKMPIDEDIQSIFRFVVAEIENEEEIKFNLIHDVQRAKKVGSVDLIISPSCLRKEIINQIENILSSVDLMVPSPSI